MVQRPYQTQGPKVVLAHFKIRTPRSATRKSTHIVPPRQPGAFPLARVSPDIVVESTCLRNLLHARVFPRKLRFKIENSLNRIYFMRNSNFARGWLELIVTDTRICGGHTNHTKYVPRAAPCQLPTPDTHTRFCRVRRKHRTSQSET